MDYLSLSQALEKLKIIPEQYQPQSIVQLAHACMEDKITPVFRYSAYALEYASGTGENTEYIIIPVKGYLTSRNITNVFNWTSQREKKTELTEAEIYELTQQEEFLYKGKPIELAKTTFNHLRPFGNAKSITFDANLTGQAKLYSSSNEKNAERIRDLGGIEISQDDLLFPKTQIEDYIDSFICENEEGYINPLIFNSLDANAKIESQKQEIDLLKADVIQLKADNDDLKKQSEQQIDTLADDSILQSILDNSHEHHAPDLKHAIQLWIDLYIKKGVGGGSHSAMANNWIYSNTGYDSSENSSPIKRLREITTPFKDFGGQRPKEIKK